jgi:hypothetical protein
MTTICYCFVTVLYFFYDFCNFLISSVSLPIHKVAQKDRHRKTTLVLISFQKINSGWLAGIGGAYKVNNQSLCLSHIVSQKRYKRSCKEKQVE